MDYFQAASTAPPGWQRYTLDDVGRLPTRYLAAVPPAEREAAALFADRFDGVESSQWSRPGTRSDGAIFTVESFAHYVIHDPIHHLVDIGEDVADK